MQIGLCTAAKNIAEVQKIGYDYIELSGNEIMAMNEEAFEALVSERARLGFPVKGFNAYCNEKTPMVGDQFREETARQYAAEICRRGAALGIEFLDIGAPFARRLPEGYDRNKADEQCMRFLEVTAQEAQKYNIKVLFEALHNQCCNYVHYTSEALAIVEKLAIDNLMINLDFYHMEIMQEAFEDAIPAMNSVGHLHYNHTPAGKLNREYIIEEDRPALLHIRDVIRAGGYDGTFSVEPDATDAFAELAPVSLKIMREVFQSEV